MNASATLKIEPFSRLIEAHRELPRLLDRLRTLRRRLDGAKRYLVKSDGPSRLGRAYWEQAKAEHEATLIRLRIVRGDVHKLLGHDRPQVNHRVA